MCWFRADIWLGQSSSTDLFVEHLRDLGATGFEIRDVSPSPDKDVETKGADRQIIAYFKREDSSSASSLQQELNTLPERYLDKLQKVNIQRHETKDWSEEWKTYFETTQLCSRIIVSPPWESPDKKLDVEYLTIEPGMAFGTGTHETTQLCAALLDTELEQRNHLNVLDVGCGSGILSMLAAQLEADNTVGIDIDAKAVELAHNNARQNNLEGDITFSTTPVDEIDEVYDIVAANILSHILLDIENALKARTANGGALILSGISLDAEPDIKDTFTGDNLKLEHRIQENEWVALQLRKSP